MPIYEYQCESCSAAIEVLQKASDPAPASCEKCGKGPMQKQMSLSSFALKGTGWYVTDFRGGSGNPNAAAGKSSTDSSKTDADGDMKSNDKTDAKSEGKTETKSEGSSTPAASSASTSDAPAKS